MRYISAPFIQDDPLGCFHACRLRLENHYIWSFLEFPADIFNRFWIQVEVSRLKLPCGCFSSEAVKNLYWL